MANQFLNAQEYSNVMLLLLKNQLVFGRLVDGQFKNEVTDENGLTINIKRPPRFIDKKDGTANLSVQRISVGSSPVAVTEYSKVHVSIGDIEYIQSYNQLMQNATMRSAAVTLANSIDQYIAKLTYRFHSWVQGGDPAYNAVLYADSTDPTKLVRSPGQAMAAHTRLMDQGVPNESLSGVVTFLDGQAIRGSLLSDFTPDINVPALQRVRIPIISEVDWYASQALPTLTAGSRTQGNGSSTGGQVNGGTQNVNYEDVKGSAGSTSYMQQTLVVKSLSANQTIKKGEVFTLQTVYAWDWRAQQKLDYLQQFTVLADTTADGTGAIAALPISPAIIVPNTGTTQGTKDVNSAFGTVDSIPADNAYIQFAGAAAANMRVKPVFHKRAISLVSARLQTPFTGVASFATDPETGISVRYWRGSDITTGDHVHRWDCVYGGGVMDPFLGTRLSGQDQDP